MPRLGRRHPVGLAHSSPALSSAARPVQRSVPSGAGSPVPLPVPWHSPSFAVTQRGSASAAAARSRGVSELQGALGLGRDRSAGYLSRDWKSFSLVPVWLDVSFVIGGRKGLVSLKDTQPGEWGGVLFGKPSMTCPFQFRAPGSTARDSKL